MVFMTIFGGGDKKIYFTSKINKQKQYTFYYIQIVWETKSHKKNIQERKKERIDWFHIIVFNMFSDEAVQLIYL